jgi:hypothetical protein
MNKYKKFSILFIILFLIISCSKKTTETDYILSAPTDLVLSQIGFESIQLTWQDNSSDEDGFRIDRKIGENEWEENYQILSENSTTFIDSNLFTIDTYYYRVYAFRDEIISGYVGSEINFSYNDVSFIEPFFTGIIDLLPNESFEYRVALKDSNGNYVQRIFDVWFKFLYKPEGTNFNNIIFNTNDSISVQSENGIASVTLNAGNTPGTAAIKAYTYNSENVEISTTHSDIVIHPGAPNSIDVTLGGISTAEDISGGFWRLQVAVMITDMYGNSVALGTAVYCSLPENPEWASIEASAYVGNENENGETYPGTAFTFLEYDGYHTNDTLLIQVEAAGIFIETEEVILPIQFPVMDIIPMNQHDSLAWFESDPESPDSLIASFHITIHDGQNNPIDNQQVIFFSTLGQPVDMCTDDDDNPYTEQTGIILYQHGRIDKDWMFYRDECPPPVGDEPGTITGTIIVSIPGTSVENEIPITLFRYP